MVHHPSKNAQTESDGTNWMIIATARAYGATGITKALFAETLTFRGMGFLRFGPINNTSSRLVKHMVNSSEGK